MTKVGYTHTFFGQPRGLSTLFFTEMWERFSYYGMRAILLFYMYYAVSRGGLGIDQQTAASVMSIYGSLVYVSSVLGGWLADRIWGAQQTVFVGGIMIMLGHFVLAMPLRIIGLFISIGLIVVGTGLLKPNISGMVGDLYGPEDKRRDAGFSMFVFGINLGAALAPIIVPWVANGFKISGNITNYHAGFALAGIGMLIGLIQYYVGSHKYLSKDSQYANDPIDRESMRIILIWLAIIVLVLLITLGILATLGNLNIQSIIGLLTVIAILIPVYYFVRMLLSRKVDAQERKRVIAFIPLFIAAAIFWSIEESGSVVLALFAEQRTRLQIGGIKLAAANFQSLNPIFIMTLTPIFVVLWDHWKKQPSAAGKFSAGLVIAGLSYVWMALPGMLFGTHGRVSPLWLLGTWLIVEIAEMLISPIGLSITSRIAPHAFRSQMISMWFLSNAVGQAVNSQIVKYYSTGTEVSYFLVIGIISVVCGIILALMVTRINTLVQNK